MFRLGTRPELCGIAEEEINVQSRSLGEASWAWLPRLECHRLCDLYYALSYHRPLRRTHLTCLTCYRRALYYRRRGWAGLERKTKFLVESDSIDPKGIVLPIEYATYWLAIRTDGFAPQLRKATCKTLMALAYMLVKAKAKLPDNWRQVKRKKKYLVIADCINPAGVVLARHYQAYWMVLTTVKSGWNRLFSLLQKQILTVAEFVAQV